jgi:hypothetical protein
VIVTPSSRLELLLLMFFIRFSEKTTSADVSFNPSEKVTLRRSLKTNFFAFADCVYDCAICGTGFLTLEPTNVSRLS